MKQKEDKNSLEARADDFITAYLKDVKNIRKKYHLNKSEAMLVLNRFEMAKLHIHIDELTNRIRDIHARITQKDPT